MSDTEACRRCGGENPPWSAASPLWNAVMRGGSINGPPIYEDMVCATCFTVLAEERGIASQFRLTAQTVNVKLETTTPSGRVWDEELFVWMDPESYDVEARGDDRRGSNAPVRSGPSRLSTVGRKGRRA